MENGKLDTVIPYAILGGKLETAVCETNNLMNIIISNEVLIVKKKLQVATELRWIKSSTI